MRIFFIVLDRRKGNSKCGVVSFLRFYSIVLWSLFQQLGDELTTNYLNSIVFIAHCNIEDIHVLFKNIISQKLSTKQWFRLPCRLMSCRVVSCRVVSHRLVSWRRKEKCPDDRYNKVVLVQTTGTYQQYSCSYCTILLPYVRTYVRTNRRYYYCTSLPQTTSTSTHALPQYLHRTR